MRECDVCGKCIGETRPMEQKLITIPNIGKLTDEEIARYFYTKKAIATLEIALNQMRRGSQDSDILYEIRHAQQLLERVLD